MLWLTECTLVLFPSNVEGRRCGTWKMFSIFEQGKMVDQQSEARLEHARAILREGHVSKLESTIKCWNREMKERHQVNQATRSRTWRRRSAWTEETIPAKDQNRCSNETGELLIFDTHSIYENQQLSPSDITPPHRAAFSLPILGVCFVCGLHVHHIILPLVPVSDVLLRRARADAMR